MKVFELFFKVMSILSLHATGSNKGLYIRDEYIFVT